jgi:hypothetical protein
MMSPGISLDSINPGWALLVQQVGQAQGNGVQGHLDEIIATTSSMPGVRLPERQPRSAMNNAPPANFFAMNGLPNGALNGLSNGSPYNMTPNQLAAMLPPNVQQNEPVYYSD